MKKKMVSLVLAAVLLVAFSGIANAAAIMCTVSRVGMHTSGVYAVELDDVGSAFGPTFFQIAGADAKAGLAVFLTALTNGTQVRITFANYTFSGMTSYFATDTPNP